MGSESMEDDVFGLVLKAKEGDEESLHKLLNHPTVQHRALKICQRTLERSPLSGYYRDAEDLKQDLLISFWKNLPKFRGENGEASFWKFFKTIARNIQVSQARKLQKEMKQSEGKSLDELSVASPEDQHLNLSIKNAMSCLTEREKSILKRRADGETLVEIAKEGPYDIGKSTVYRELEEVQKKFVAHVEGYTKAGTAKQKLKRKNTRKKPE